MNVLIPEAYRLRAAAYAQKGMYNHAAADLTAFLRQAPGTAQVYSDRGLARIKQGKFQAAFEDFTHALRMNRTDASIFANRGLALRALQRHDLALRDLTNAVLLDPKHAPAYCGQLGLVQSARGDYSLAIANFSVALLLDPSDPNVPAWREEAARARRAAKRGWTEAAPIQVVAASPAAATDGTVAPLLLGSNSEIEVPALPAAAPGRNTARIDRGNDTDFELNLAATATAAAAQAAAVAKRAAVAGDHQPPAAHAEKTLEHQTQPTAEQRKWSQPAAEPRKWGQPTTPWMDPNVSASGAVKPTQPLARPARRKPEVDWEQRRKWLMYAGAALVVIAVIGGTWAFLANRSAEGRQEVPVSATVAAKELWEEYFKDSAAANRKYGNQFVRVSGKINMIPLNAKTPIVVLETPTKARWTIEFVFPKRDDLKGLSNGQEVTIQGECEQRANPQINLQVTQCKTVPGK
jgi:tetratricopeptide (TPR) repeat protein